MRMWASVDCCGGHRTLPSHSPGYLTLPHHTTHCTWIIQGEGESCIESVMWDWSMLSSKQIQQREELCETQNTLTVSSARNNTNTYCRLSPPSEEVRTAPGADLAVVWNQQQTMDSDESWTL